MQMYENKNFTELFYNRIKTYRFYKQMQAELQCL